MPHPRGTSGGGTTPLMSVPSTHHLSLAVPDVNVTYPNERTVPEHMPKLSFLGAIVASRGMGKTHALMQLVQLYNKTKTFDRIVVVSPTYDADPKYKLFERMDAKLFVYREYSDAIKAEIEQGIRNANDEYEEYLEAMKAWKKLQNEQNAHDMTEHEYNLLESVKFKKPVTQWTRGPPTTLFIADDCVATTLYRGDCKGPFNSFAIRHRHARTSIIFVSQTWANAIPRQLRANLSFLMLFKCKSVGIAKEIASEFGSYICEEEFKAVWDDATKERFGFLYLDWEAPNGEQVRKGFTECYDIQVHGPKSGVGSTDDKPKHDDEVPYAIRTGKPPGP